MRSFWTKLESLNGQKIIDYTMNFRILAVLALLTLMVSPAFAVIIGNSSSTAHLDMTAVVRRADGSRWMMMNNFSNLLDSSGILVKNITANNTVVQNFTFLGRFTVLAPNALFIKNDGTIIIPTNDIFDDNAIRFYNISSTNVLGSNITAYTSGGASRCDYPTLPHRDGTSYTSVCDRETIYSSNYVDWQNQTQLQAVNDNWGDIVQLANGSRMIYYQSTGVVRVQTSNDSSTNWTEVNPAGIVTPTAILNERSTGVAIGNQYVFPASMLIGGDTNFTVYFIIVNSSGQFVVDANLSTTTEHQTDPNLRIDTNGNRYIFWDSNFVDQSTDSFCYGSYNTSSGWQQWSVAAPLQGNGCTNAYPRGKFDYIASDALNPAVDNRLDFGWMQYTSSGVYVYHLDNWTILASNDNTSPTVTVQQPSGLKTSPNLTLNFTVSDDIALDTDTCEYSVDGAASVALPNCDNITFIAAEGAHNVTVYATDTSMNTGSGTSSFSVDTTAPSVLVTSPTGTNSFSDEADINLSLIFTVTDATSGVNSSSCQYSLDDGANISLPSCDNITFTTTTGSHTLDVYVTDLAGHQGSGSTTFSVALLTFADTEQGDLLAIAVSLVLLLLLVAATDFNKPVKELSKNILFAVVMSGVVYVLLSVAL
jgi:hypothetical protein